MKKTIMVVMMIAVILVSLLINPSLVRATEEETGLEVTTQEPIVSTSVYGTNKSIKVELTNIELDDTHEYKFGVSVAKATQPTEWYDLSEIEKDSATVIITSEKEDMRTILRTKDSAYVFIKDTTEDEIIIDGTKVSLDIPLSEALNISFDEENMINVAFLYKGDTNIFGTDKGSSYYYKVVKINDTKIIEKYLEAKNNNADTLAAVQDLLTEDVPTSGWIEMETSYSSYASSDKSMDKLAEYEGLYYVWCQASFEEGRSVYGYTLYDNYPEGYKLADQEDETNKSTTDEDSDNKDQTTTDEDSNNKNQITTDSDKSNTVKNDNTVATTKIPQTGENIAIIVAVAAIVIISVIGYKISKKYKDIK